MGAADLRDDLYRADAVLDVLYRALADINHDQGAIERNVVDVARGIVLRVASALDEATLPAGSTPPEAA